MAGGVETVGKVIGRLRSVMERQAYYLEGIGFLVEIRKKIKLAGVVLLLPMLLSGCDAFSSEPTYGGLSIAGFNYTPYNLERFVITDNYGNRAGGGGDLMPGSGQGSLSCCYKLKGTEFTVNWSVYDVDEAIRASRASESYETFYKTAQVHMPPTKAKSDRGLLVLGLHFYPDDHVEFEFRTDLQGTRIIYGDVWYWLLNTHAKLINPHNEHETSVVFRRAARLTAKGWIKHRFTDTKDLQQYAYYTLLNPKFDEHPEVQKILSETKDQPGAFGVAMENLPAPLVEELKRNTFKQTATSRNHG